MISSSKTATTTTTTTTTTKIEENMESLQQDDVVYENGNDYSFHQELRKMTGTPGLLFPVTLHKILSESTALGHDVIISWLPNGRAFKIHDRDEFVEKILPKYYPSYSSSSSLAPESEDTTTTITTDEGSSSPTSTTKSGKTTDTSKQLKWKSFLRQINLYGFERISKKKSKLGTIFCSSMVDKSEVGAYIHKHFRRDEIGLCCLIQRKDGKSKRRSPPPAKQQQQQHSPTVANAKKLSLLAPSTTTTTSTIISSSSLPPYSFSFGTNTTIAEEGSKVDDHSVECDHSSSTTASSLTPFWDVSQKDTAVPFGSSQKILHSNFFAEEQPPCSDTRSQELEYIPGNESRKLSHDEELYDLDDTSFWHGNEDEPEDDHHDKIDFFSARNIPNTFFSSSPSTAANYTSFEVSDTISLDGESDMNMSFLEEDGKSSTANAGIVSTVSLLFAATSALSTSTFSPQHNSTIITNTSSTSLLANNNNKDEVAAGAKNQFSSPCYYWTNSGTAAAAVDTYNSCPENVVNGMVFVTPRKNDGEKKTMEDLIVENESLLATLFPDVKSSFVDYQQSYSSISSLPKQMLQVSSTISSTNRQEGILGEAHFPLAPQRHQGGRSIDESRTTSMGGLEQWYHSLGWRNVINQKRNDSEFICDRIEKLAKMLEPNPI